VLGLVASCGLAACNAVGSLGVAPNGDVRAEISDAWAAHIEAGKAKDEEGVVDIYAADVFYQVPGIEARGKEEIDALERETMATTDVIDAKHTTRQLEVHGDLAYELGTIVGPVRPHGQEAVVMTFHFMAQWKRGADGVWRLRRLVGEPEG